MEKLVTAEEMKKIEAYTIETLGVPAIVLMERAALSVVEVMESFLTPQDKVLLVCGTGNNGADGLAAARMLAAEGYDIAIAIVGSEEKATELWKTQKAIIEKLRVPNGTMDKNTEYTVIVDALFGIGLSREITGAYRDAILWINARRTQGARIVSVDVPSGLDCSTGAIYGCCVHADDTVTFQYTKRGMLLFPGADYVGTIHKRDVGILAGSHYFTSFRAEICDVQACLPERATDSNKGTYGKVLMIAGSEGMCGAAYFAASAAYRAGAGLVRIYTPSCNRIPLQTMLPEAMITVAEEESLDSALGWATVVCIGPGLSTKESGVLLLERVLSANKPVVIDADALNLLAVHPELLSRLTESMIVTPHLSEMARLTGRPIAELKENLPAAAKSFCEKYRARCVLKDAHTVIATSPEVCYINTSGNPGMATGGTGDVLAGLLTGLLAVGTPVNCAAFLGPLLHGIAGTSAMQKRGMASMTARDVLEEIRM